tara:strand:+ start:694 stop:897 length:204 start_codon:yes stop_codon:yes gene_type:complete
MYEPPPQAKEWSWVWTKWIYGFYKAAVYTTGPQTLGGTITLTGIPTTDPELIGQLWNDSGTVKISEG